MRLHVYIPYSRMKSVYGVKFLKDCDSIIETRFMPVLKEITTRMFAHCVWDDEGEHRIAVSLSFDIEGKNIEKVLDVFDCCAEHVEILTCRRR